MAIAVDRRRYLKTAQKIDVPQKYVALTI